jgi:hypothetical protein
MRPRSGHTVASRGGDADVGHVVSAQERCDSSTSSHLSEVLTDLSSTVNRIRGLQQLHVGDDALASPLRRAAAELESLISRLLHTDGSGSGSPPTLRSSTTAHLQRAAEQAFLVWLAIPSSADEAPLAGIAAAEPLARVLGELSLSGRVLPAETAASIGVPGGTTVGHVATELLLAVKDPAGPRCRSYRAAVVHLRDLDRGRSTVPVDGKVGR